MHTRPTREDSLEPRPDAPAGGYAEDVSLLGLGNTLLRRWRIVLLFPLLGAALALLLVVIQPREYVATSIFAPQSAQSSASRVAGLAAQFGFALPTGGASSESIDFYSTLLQTRSLLRAVVTEPFAVARGGDTAQVTLIDAYDIDADNREQAVRAAVGRLSQSMEVAPDSRTGTLTLRVTAPDPALAVQASQRMLALVEQFNVERRQTQARAEHEFIVARLEEAAAELRNAESALARFLAQNRGYEGSPELQFQEARMRRTVDLRQSVYNTLAQSAEQSAIEQVRNTPVLTVVEEPAQTVRGVPRNYPLAFMMGLIGGGIIGIATALVLGFIDRQKTDNPEDLAEFRRLIRRLTPRALRRSGEVA